MTTTQKDIPVWTPEFAEGTAIELPHKSDSETSGVFIGIQANACHSGRSAQARSVVLSLAKAGYVDRLISISECSTVVREFMGLNTPDGGKLIAAKVDMRYAHHHTKDLDIGLKDILLIDVPLAGKHKAGAFEAVESALRNGSFVVQVSFDTTNSGVFLSAPDILITLEKEPKVPGAAKTNTRKVKLPNDIHLVREKAPVLPADLS